MCIREGDFNRQLDARLGLWTCRGKVKRVKGDEHDAETLKNAPDEKIIPLAEPEITIKQIEEHYLRVREEAAAQMYRNIFRADRPTPLGIPFWITL